MSNMKDIIAEVSATRQRRPDLPMIGLSSNRGQFNVCYFPDYGKTSTPKAEYLARGLSLPAALDKLRAL